MSSVNNVFYEFHYRHRKERWQTVLDMFNYLYAIYGTRLVKESLPFIPPVPIITIDPPRVQPMRIRIIN